jgi:hypothetical protein
MFLCEGKHLREHLLCYMSAYDFYMMQCKSALSQCINTKLGNVYRTIKQLGELLMA